MCKAPSIQSEKLLLYLNLIIFIDALGVALVLPNVTFLFTDLGGTAKSFGMLSATYSAAQLVGGLALGYLADRSLGHDWALLISFAGASLSYILVGVADALPLLVASRIIVGLTKQTVTCCTALTSSLTAGADRTKALAKLSSAMTLASLIGSSIGGLLAQQFGRRIPCFVASALYIANISLVRFALPHSYLRGLQSVGSQGTGDGASAGRNSIAAKSAGAAHPSSELSSFGRFLASLRGPGGGILALRLMYGLLLRAVYSLHALYEAQEWALTPLVAGYLASYSQLLGLVVEWGVIGRLADLVPERTLLLASLCVAALNSALEWNHRLLFLYILVHLPVGAVAKSITRSCLTSLFTKSVPVADVGLALSMLNICQSAVSVVAPLYGGLMLGRLGLAAQPAAAALNYVLLFVLSAWLVRARIPARSGSHAKKA